MSTEVPDEAALRQQVDRRQLQEIISGLGEGILLIDPVEGIVWANDRALALHDVSELADLGMTADGYRQRFALRLPQQSCFDRWPVSDRPAAFWRHVSGRDRGSQAGGGGGGRRLA